MRGEPSNKDILSVTRCTVCMLGLHKVFVSVGRAYYYSKHFLAVLWLFGGLLFFVFLSDRFFGNALFNIGTMAFTRPCVLLLKPLATAPVKHDGFALLLFFLDFLLPLWRDSQFGMLMIKLNVAAINRAHRTATAHKQYQDECSCRP